MKKPAFEGIDAVYKSKADNKDIRDLLEKLVPKAKQQMQDFSKSFKGASEKETCKKIFNYLKNNFTYVADGDEQIIKLPSALLNKKVGDCKSYALFTASILENLGIPYSFIYASYNSNPIPQHVYVTTKNGCIIDAVYGKFNQEKKPTYKYKKNMNVRYMAGIGCANCGGNCSHKRMGALKLPKITIISKDKRQAAAAAIKSAAASATSKIAQGTKTATLAPARNLLLLIIKNNLDGFASKLSNTNTANLMSKWYSLGGDRTILGNAIRTGASKPAKKFGFLPKLKQAIGNRKLNGIGATEVPADLKSKVISICTAAGTAIGGANGAAVGAMLGGVVVSLLPTIYDAIMKVSPQEETTANAPLNAPDLSTIDMSVSDSSSSTTAQGGNNKMLFVGLGLAAAAGLYFATKNK